MMNVSTARASKRSISSTNLKQSDLSLVLMTMFSLVFLSAFALIYVKYESQQLYMNYNILKTQEVKLHNKQNKLQLEKATLASHKRTYNYARAKQMYVPEGSKIVILT